MDYFMEDTFPIIMMMVVGIALIAGVGYLWLHCIEQKAKKQDDKKTLDEVAIGKKIFAKFFPIIGIIGIILVLIVGISKFTTEPSYDLSDGISEDEGKYIKDVNDWYSENYGE